MRTRIRSLATLLPIILLRSPLSAQVWEVDNQLLIDGDDGNSLARFGSSLAAGDFDGDGDTDLAVGAPNQNASAGFVHLFRSGGESGLAVAAVPTMAGAFSSEQYGAALAAGDFNNDGKKELVIGAPGWDAAGPIDQAGRVVVWGTVSGVWTNLGTLSQSGTPSSPEAMDHFGKSLAVGKFNSDNFDDLAVGAPDEDITGTTYSNAGAVIVYYGSASGLTTSGSQAWFRNGGGVNGTIADDQLLGRALAAGDFDGDQLDDLAIGADDTFTGHVVVLFGSAGSGLITTSQQAIFGDDLPQNPGGKGFSEALAAGDLNRTSTCENAVNCADELVVGMTTATVVLPNTVSVFNAGAVFVLYGSSSFGGLDPASTVRLTQLDVASPDGPQNGDHLGAALAVGALGGSDLPDLALGAPDESFTSFSGSGAAHVLLAGENPLASGFSQGLFEQTGLASAPMAATDRFGAAFAIGDFDHDSYGDLAIGIPNRNLGANADAGAVQILYGALFADGFESLGLTNWSNF